MSLCGKCYGIFGPVCVFGLAVAAHAAFPQLDAVSFSSGKVVFMRPVLGSDGWHMMRAVRLCRVPVAVFVATQTVLVCGG